MITIKERLEKFIRDNPQRMTNKEYAQVMNCSESHISHVIRDINHSERKWSKEDTLSLIDYYYDGYTFEEIATFLDRTRASVSTRVTLLRKNGGMNILKRSDIKINNLKQKKCRLQES